jgi:hypothetical protein
VPTGRAPSGARGHLDLGLKGLVQTGFDLKSLFNSNGFRPRRKPDWPVYWQPWSYSKKTLNSIFLGPCYHLLRAYFNSRGWGPTHVSVDFVQPSTIEKTCIMLSDCYSGSARLTGSSSLILSSSSIEYHCGNCGPCLHHKSADLLVFNVAGQNKRPQ